MIEAPPAPRQLFSLNGHKPRPELIMNVSSLTMLLNTPAEDFMNYAKSYIAHISDPDIYSKLHPNR